MLKENSSKKKVFNKLSPYFALVVFFSVIILVLSSNYIFYRLEKKLENFPYNYSHLVYPGYKSPLKKSITSPLQKAEVEKPKKPLITSKSTKKTGKFRIQGNKIILESFTDLQINRDDKL